MSQEDKYTVICTKEQWDEMGKFTKSGFGQTLLHKQKWPPSKCRIERVSVDLDSTTDDFIPEIKEIV